MIYRFNYSLLFVLFYLVETKITFEKLQFGIPFLHCKCLNLFQGGQGEPGTKGERGDPGLPVRKL